MITRDWKAAGDNLLIYDDVNNRDWLSFSETTWIPYDNVRRELGPEGKFAGFVSAAFDDVQGLARSAGLDTTTQEFSANFAATADLLGALGVRVEPEATSSVRAFGLLSETVKIGPIRNRLEADLAIIFNFDGTPFAAGLDRAPNPSAVTDDESSPQHASWLYRPAPSEPERLGDFDGNGVLDLSDIDRLSEAVREGRDLSFDVNFDSLLNQLDRQIWVEELRGTFFGDSNLDGAFDSLDIVAVLRAGEYEDAVPGNSGWGDGDWNGDGDFDRHDVVFALQSTGFMQGTQTALAVPEPSSLMMLTISIFIGVYHTLQDRGIGKRTMSAELNWKSTDPSIGYPTC